LTPDIVVPQNAMLEAKITGRGHRSGVAVKENVKNLLRAMP
jgi:hypothetical protein